MGDFKDFVERVKAAVDLAAVIAETGGLTLTKSGRYYKTAEHPSLVIDPERGWWEWYSKSGTGAGRAGGPSDSRGDVFAWLMHHGGIPDFKDAVRWVSERTGLEYAWDEAETKRYHATKARQGALGVIADFLAAALWSDAGAAALDYARRRGWEDETIREGQLGFWSWELAKGLRSHLLMHEVDTSRPEVVAILGLRGDVWVWSERWEIPIDKRWVQEQRIPGAPQGLLIYPHIERGNCVYLAGRRLDWTPESEFGKSWNLRAALVGGRRPYWNYAHDLLSEYVVVVEGQGDAVSLAEWGIPAVALAGTRADTALIEQLKRHERIYVALDSDKAGDSGTQHLADELGPGCLVATWPGGGDANDFMKRGASADDCKRVLLDAPIYALWRAQRLHQVPLLERKAARREVYELVASLMPYDYATWAGKLAVELGHFTAGGAPSVGELQKIVRAIKVERDLAAQGVEEAQKDKKKERPQTTSSGGVAYKELTPELTDVLVSRSRDHEGHARCCRAVYGDKLAFVPEWGWLVYNGTHWEREGADHKAQGLVVRTLKMRRHLGVEQEVEALVKATPASNSNVKSTKERLERLVLAKTDDFDQSPDLLNCQNGVLNLRTGELVQHDSTKYRFTYCLPTAYRPDADYSDWLVFLGQVTGESDKNGIVHVDKDLLDWLQMAVGYSLTGHTSEGCLFYLYGPTRAGKGVFTQTIQRLLGKPLAAGIDFSILVQQRNEDSQNFALAPLKPCRLLVGSEPGKYERFNEAKMKMLTGEDTVRCALKRRDQFEYEPQYKIWLSSNWPFNADTADSAAWGRARIVRFPNSFLGQEDKGLKRRLQSQASMEGVLAWAVEGAKLWYAQPFGLPIPAAVVDEGQEQRSAQDYIQQFIDECCTVAEVGEHFVSTKDVYGAYRGWCAGELTPMKARSFGLSLQSKGFTNGRSYVDVAQSFLATSGEVVTRKQVRGFFGLALNSIGQDCLVSVSKKH